MAGGPGKINEYNQSLTPEQRKKNARKAGIASGESRTSARICDIRQIARMINEAPVHDEELLRGLARVGIRDERLTNAAGIALAVYCAAIDGDMKAVEKWERYTGQYFKDDGKENDNGVLPDLIAGLQDDED